MSKLKPCPTETSILLGSRRWNVTVSSGKTLMQCGEMVERVRHGMLGQQATERYYEYGKQSIGGAAPKEMPNGALINLTSDPGIYLVEIKDDHGLCLTDPVLMGPEVFTKFGFEPPK